MWLLESEVKRQIEQAIALGLEPSAEQKAEFTARMLEARAVDGSPLLTKAGDTARIEITGVMTKEPDFFARIFGGGNTTYSDILSALAEAESDPAVANIELAVDSPGGAVDGLFDVLDAVSAAKKPTSSVVTGKATSAAYAIVAKTGSIVATNAAVMFGSIGIAAEFFVSDHIIDIASTDAPNKRPDVTTEEGRAVVREQLDALHDLFVEAIADGRGVTADTVNTNFGRGAVVLARAARDRGMIDTVQGATLAVVVDNSSTASGGQLQPETGNMDLEKLKAEHPALYAQIVALGVTQGVAQERDRVTAHLTMGEASGDMATATAAVADGSEMTETLRAKYMTAGMNRANVQARADDDDAAGAAADGAGDAGAGAGADGGAGDDTDVVAGLVEKQLGMQAQA